MPDRMSSDGVIVVTGAGGFIGGWLVADLLSKGFRRVRAVDLKPPAEWFQRFTDAENITADLLMAAREARVRRYFFSSSACVYAAEKQVSAEVTPLREEDAYPAMPEDGYGWEKLFSERMCRHFTEDFGLVTRVARYHNVYGPNGTWDGGREKAPAAICRKVIAAKLSGDHTIEIW